MTSTIQPTEFLDATEVSVSIVDVTPELAQEWLRFNEKNRNIRDDRVRQYADDMTAGNWRFTADPIHFATVEVEEGERLIRLIDGQHRLRAIVKSATTQKMLVASGLSPDAQAYIDGGVPRRASDMLRMNGVGPLSNLIASIIRNVLVLDNTRRGNRSFSTPTTLAYLDANPAIETIASAVKGVRVATGLSETIVGTVSYYAYMVRPEATINFIQRLKSGAGLLEGDPVLMLTRRFAAAPGIKKWQLYYLVISAYLMEFQGNDGRTKLSLPRGANINQMGVAMMIRRLLSLSPETAVSPLVDADDEDLEGLDEE